MGNKVSFLKQGSEINIFVCFVQLLNATAERIRYRYKGRLTADADKYK